MKNLLPPSPAVYAQPPLRDYASNACGKPALDGNFSSPHKLGGVPLRGGGGLPVRMESNLPSLSGG